MKNKQISLERALDGITDGSSIMINCFQLVGAPMDLVNALVDRQLKDLTIICVNAHLPGIGIGALLRTHSIKKLITCHVLFNPEVRPFVESGEVELELVPIGTWTERIRIAGAGIGGFLTTVGVGTVVEEGKQKIKRNGITYLLEEPLSADVALIRAWKADEFGNLVYRRTARTFAHAMATASKLVVAEAEHIVPIGAIDPDYVMTSGIYIDRIVQSTGDKEDPR